MAKTRAANKAARTSQAEARKIASFVTSKSNDVALLDTKVKTARDGKPLPTDLEYHSFANSAEFEVFMERAHLTSPGFYLKTAKKSSGVPSIDLPDATVVALCFGWIDGWGKGIDDIWRFIRFTPRRSKSIWSQKNVSTVEMLQAQGRMKPAGIAVVEAAKADGRWDRAYAGPANMITPKDVQDALDTNAAAEAFFNSMSRTEKYAVLIRIETASPKTRSVRIEALIQQLSSGCLATKKSSSKAGQEKKISKTKSKITSNK